jgi:molecular chaperone DnaK
LLLSLFLIPIPCFIHFFHSSLIHSVSKNVSEHGDKLDENTKTEIQKAIDEAKSLGADASLDVLKEKCQALSSASMKIGQAMYGGAKKEDSDSSSNPSSPNSNAEEADFKEKQK